MAYHPSPTVRQRIEELPYKVLRPIKNEAFGIRVFWIGYNEKQKKYCVFKILDREHIFIIEEEGKFFKSKKEATKYYLEKEAPTFAFLELKEGEELE